MSTPSTQPAGAQAPARLEIRDDHSLIEGLSRKSKDSVSRWLIEGILHNVHIGVSLKVNRQHHPQWEDWFVAALTAARLCAPWLEHHAPEEEMDPPTLFNLRALYIITYRGRNHCLPYKQATVDSDRDWYKEHKNKDGSEITDAAWILLKTPMDHEVEGILSRHSEYNGSWGPVLEELMMRDRIKVEKASKELLNQYLIGLALARAGQSDSIDKFLRRPSSTSA